MELLTVMRERKNVCKYLDIALQHCSDHMLKNDAKGVTKQQTIDLINKIREEVPGNCITYDSHGRTSRRDRRGLPGTGRFCSKR